MGQAPPPHHRPPRPARGRLVPAGRVLIGRPYDGRPKTDATWSKPGTGHYDPDQAGWWAQQPYRRRAAIAWLVPGAIVFCGYGWLTDSVAVRGVVWLAAWFGIVWALWTTHYETKRWTVKKRWIEVIHRSIYQDLEVPRKRRAADYIHVPRGGEHIHNPDKPIVITLPDNFKMPPESPQRAKLALKVAEAGGIMINNQQMQAHYPPDAEPRTLIVACDKQPPELVKFDSKIIKMWDDLEDDEVLVGLSHAGVPVKRSLAGDSPHILCSIGTGGGKTEFCCSVALQRRYKVGAKIIILDFVKRGGSSKWAKGIDGIEIIRQVEPAYETLLKLRDEVEDRTEGEYHDETGEYAPQEIFVIFEEAGASIGKLRRYEKQLQRDDKEAPSAIDAFQDILNVGRQARVNMLVVAQRASHKALGGGDIRDSFGLIVAGRFRPGTARMLFEDVGDGTKASLPRSSNHPGRWQVVTGGVAEETQGVLVINSKSKRLLPEPAELARRPYTTLGNPVRPGLSSDKHTADTGAVAVVERPAEVIEAEIVEETPLEPRVVDLAEAAELLRGRRGYVTLTSLRNLRRDYRQEFEACQRGKTEDGRTYLYDLVALDHFMANLPRAGSQPCR